MTLVAKFYTAKKIQLHAISLMDVSIFSTVNTLLTLYTKKPSFVRCVIEVSFFLIFMKVEAKSGYPGNCNRVPSSLTG